MKKDLINITEEEVLIICEILGEPYIGFITNSHGSWTSLGLAVSIETTTTLSSHPKHSNDDSHILIYYNGKIRLSRNNGGWGGMRDEEVNALPIIDFLRGRGYEFKYELPEKLERKLKLQNINKKESD